MSIDICGRCSGPVCAHGICLDCGRCRECGSGGEAYYRERHEDYVRDYGEPREQEATDAK